MGRDLSSLDIKTIKGVGPKIEGLLARLGIASIRDALFCLPFRYEDRRAMTSLVEARDGELQSFTGKVVSADLMVGGRRVSAANHSRPVKGRKYGKPRLDVIVGDGTGLIKCTWFNQPWLANRFHPGASVMVSGKVKRTRRAPHYEMQNPVYELFSGQEPEPTAHAGRVVPVYQSTEGLSPRHLRAIITSAVEAFADEAADAIPEAVLKRHGLPALPDSIRAVHSPPEDEDIEAFNRFETPWQARLAFGEFFMLEAGLAVLRRGKKKEPGIAFKEACGGLVDGCLKALPFTLTGAQERVLDAISADMAGPHPMHRLLQGDVGSGKTIVALLAMLRAVDAGYQAALMAPTEILSGQHFMNISNMVDGLGIDVRLVTGASKKGIMDVASGSAGIVVGTHALIQEGMSFDALGLAVIDEQHRFGVRQRAELRRKGAGSLSPDVLIMTATPIPRTLSLTLYGDLDYSVIDELPPGRTPVVTTMHAPDDKHRVYDAIREEAGSGGQVYVVYPLIEESEKADLKSAVTGAEALARMYPDTRVGLVHGRMRPAEKEEVMSGFQAREIDILVSTTVIEVGVDVPNASLMVIANSERFGLSQLHQLRGRVGRGVRRSRCMLLVGGPLSEDASRRLEIMCATNDGFRVAEMDLEIRGPGEFMGTRQSGMPDLRVADLIRDARVLEQARGEAFALVEADPLLEAHPGLRLELERFWRGKVEIFGTG